MYNNTIENSISMLEERPDRHTAATVAKTSLIILSLLVVVGSGLLIFYATTLHPVELRTQATRVVHTILNDQAQATAASSPASIYAQLTRKTPTFNNSMNAQMGGWDTGNIGNSSCTFTDGAYQSRVASDLASFTCLNSGNNYSNFVFQVQMTILDGSGGGILLRSPGASLDGYKFEVSTNGLYYIGVVTNTPPTTRKVLFGHSTFVHYGLKQLNLLTVIARGKHLSFYINKQFINSFDDETFSTGFVCLTAFNHRHQPGTDVAFNNAQLWAL